MVLMNEPGRAVVDESLVKAGHNCILSVNSNVDQGILLHRSNSYLCPRDIF